MLSWVKNDKSHEIFSDGVVVSSVNTAEHLRNSIGNNSQKHILKTNNDFVKRLNLIMSVFRSSSVHVKYRLRPTGCHYIGMAFGTSHLMKKTDFMFVGENI